MAIATLSPTPSSSTSDMVTLEEAAELFAATGHPVRTRTLKRWCLKHGVRVVGRKGCDDQASWSDLLDVHALEVDRRTAGR